MVTRFTSMAMGAAGLLASLDPAAGAPDALARLRGASRVLVVSAPAEGDARLAQQRAAFAALGPGARERDLVLLEAVGNGAEARAIRGQLGLDARVFAAVLVGKDGGAKLRAGTVLGADQLFPTIDAMPMRRREMRR